MGPKNVILDGSPMSYFGYSGIFLKCGFEEKWRKSPPKQQFPATRLTKTQA